MSEHDSPTVARATLWLDTSNGTDTRRVPCLDEAETQAFEAPAAAQQSAGPRVAGEATAVLDRHGGLEGTDSDATRVLEPASKAKSGRTPLSAIARCIASHALAFVLGAAVLAATARLGSEQGDALTASSHAQAASQSPKAQRAEVPAPTKPQPSAPHAPASVSAAPPPALAEAVDALARGDYIAASLMYEQLAAARPNEASLAAVASILQSRARAACANGSKEPPCAR